MTFKTTNITREAATSKTRTWDFLRTDDPPPDLKRLRQVDKDLMENWCPTNNAPYTTIFSPYIFLNTLYSYDNLLIELLSLIKSMDKSGHEWDLYSKFITSVYGHKSVSCYISMKEDFNPKVIDLSNKIYDVIKSNLIENKNRVFENPIRFCCSWLATHLLRMNRNKAIGLKYHRANRTYVNVVNENSEQGLTEFRVPTCKTLMKCIDILVEEGYALTLKGFKNSAFDKTMLSLLIPTSKLLNLINQKQPECVIVKEHLLTKMVEIRNEDKTSILEQFYKQEWIMDIEKSKKILHKHNQLILDTEITVDETLLEGLQVMRIHNDGSPEYGGRLYDDGTWTTMRRETRKRVKINGESNVTIDLSYLHPSLLYAKEGINIEGFDPYAGVDIFVDTEMVEKFKSYYGFKNYNPVRNACKIALLIMINSHSEYEAISAIEKKMARNFTLGGTIKEDEMLYVGLSRHCASQLVQQIKQLNSGISKYFCTGIAKKLMRVDSDIMLEALDVLADNKICSLPLHDSITVQKSKADFAEKTLREAYIKVVGSDLNYKVKFE